MRRATPRDDLRKQDRLVTTFAQPGQPIHHVSDAAFGIDDGTSCECRLGSDHHRAPQPAVIGPCVVGMRGIVAKIGNPTEDSRGIWIGFEQGDLLCHLAGHPQIVGVARGDQRSVHHRKPSRGGPSRAGILLPSVRNAPIECANDGFGFVVAEAMACGLPVIVTRDAGAAEWVEAGCGWSVPSADADALAAALNDAIDRRGELPEMGARARASVLARVARRDNSLPFFDAVSCC